MSINTDFYGSNYYTLPGYNGGIKTANFTGATTPDRSASILQYAINAGKYTAGTLVDSSASTHGIPGTLNGHSYNTMYDYGAVNCRLTNADCVRDRQSGGSLPIMWRCRYSNNGDANTSIMYNVYNNMVLNAPGRNETWDLYRYNAIVSADFKKFMMCIVVIAFDGTITDNGDGTYTGSVSRYNVMDLNCYLSSALRYDNGTKTARDYYPYISQIYLVPASGSSFDNFNLQSGIEQSLGCIPNTLYNFACSKVVNNTPTDDNTPNAVITNAASYMDGVPNSGGSVVYLYYAGDTETTSTVSFVSGVLSHFCIFGMVGGNGTSSGVVTWIPSGDNLQGYLHGVRGFTHCRIVRVDSSGGVYSGFSYWHDMPTTAEEIKDAILKMCSYMGCMISTSIYGMLNDFDRSPRYIGVLDDNGIATGNYEEITAETLADFVQTATDDFIDNTPYDPAAASDPNTYTDTMPTGQAPPVQSCNRYYALNATNIGRLYEGLLNTLSSVPTGEMEDYLLSHFATSSPIDLLNSLKWLPFDFVSRCFDTSGEHTIFIGGLALHDNHGNAVTGYRAREATEFSITINIGNFNLFRHFGDFRDFEPYTGVDVYIPFCTPISVKPSMCMGHDIAVQISIDIITGNITGRLRLDSAMGIIIATTSGNCAIDLPISGIDTATYNNAMYQAVQNAKSADRGLAAAYIGAFTGGASAIAGTAGATDKKPLSPAAAVSGVDTAVNSTFGTVNAWQNKINADYQLSHVPVPYHNISAVNSALAMLQPLHTYVIISRPVMLPGYNDRYGHTTGYATIYNGTLDGLSGLTVCASADLSGIPATAEEKEMISAALKSGVYL